MYVEVYLWVTCMSQVLSASPVDETAALTTGATVLIVSPPISSTLTGNTHTRTHARIHAHTLRAVTQCLSLRFSPDTADPILENQEGLDGGGRGGAWPGVGGGWSQGAWPHHHGIANTSLTDLTEDTQGCQTNKQTNSGACHQNTLRLFLVLYIFSPEPCHTTSQSRN